MDEKIEKELESILEDPFLHEGGGPRTREEIKTGDSHQIKKLITSNI